MEEQKEQEKPKNAQPHVRIFGEEVGAGKKEEKQGCCEGDCRRPAYRPGSAVWGLLVLLGGILLLLNNFGLVSWRVWDFIWPFWPVVLILIGIRILLGNSWLSELLMFLIALAVFGCIIFYGLAQVGSPLLNSVPPAAMDIFNQFKF